MKIRKNLLSVLLAAAMVLSLLPVLTLPALAASHTYYIDYGGITISQNTSDSSMLDVTYYASSGAPSSTTDTIAASDAIVITQTNSGTPTANAITVGSGTAGITIQQVNISVSSGSAFSISSGATVNMMLSGANTLKTSDYYAGLHVPYGATLTINKGTSDTDDSLTATGGDKGAGIGGRYNRHGGTVKINGGTVNATGGNYGAGIGGGAGGNGGTVTINGGEVTAKGGSCGAGIGGGYNGDGGTVKIYGGTVNATGGDNATGIGGSDVGDGGTVDIYSGTVNATGGDNSAGIGCGSNGGDGITLNIYGGTVNATAGNYGTGIGGISPVTCVIDGGSVNASINAQPKNSSGNYVYLSTVTLSGISNIADISYTLDGGVTKNSCATDSNGKLYLWLPVSSSVTIDTVNETLYTTHYIATNCTVSSSNTNVFTALEKIYINASKADAVYDGSSHAGYTVTVNYASGDEVTSGTYSFDGAIYYSGSTAGGTALSGAPSDPGTYTVLLSLTSTVYYVLPVTVTFTINRATPAIVALPTTSRITSGSKLSDSIPSGGAAAGVDGNALDGTFAWVNGDTVLTADGDYDLVFTPKDTTNYTNVSVTVHVFLCPILSDIGASAISDSEASLNFTSDQAGTYYYLVYKAYAAAPSASAVKAQGNSEAKGTGSASAEANTVSVTGLLASSSYVAYVVVIDSDGNSSNVSAIAFTTAQKDTPPPTLSALTLDKGDLSPEFASGTTKYTATVSNSTDSITVTAAASDSGSTVTVNGNSASASTPVGISLNVGSNAITVVVTGKDGVTKSTYTVTVTREAAFTITTTSLPLGIVGSAYSKTLSAKGGSGSYMWSAEGLPAVLTLDENTGMITGTPTLADTGTYSVKMTVSDGSATATATFTLTINEGCGNGAYLIESDGDGAYTGSYTDDGIPTLTVNDGVTGFTYFRVNISTVTGHTGTETCVFVQTRSGTQIAFSFLTVDFDTVSKAGAGFNVKPGDVIEVYLVDSLSNSGGSPSIL